MWCCSQRAKFLVVISVHILFDSERMNELVCDYHDKLQELFGQANYQSVIPTLHFVITQNDRKQNYPGCEAPYTEETVNDKLDDLAIDIFKMQVMNPHLAEFVTRIKTSHTLVDYTTQTGRELRDTITSVVTATPFPGRKCLSISPFPNPFLAAHLPDACMSQKWKGSFKLER